MPVIDIAFPNFTGTTTEAQLSEIKSFLFGLTDKLNYALQSVEVEGSADVTYTPYTTSSSATSVQKVQKKGDLPFNEIRDLIINSSEIFTAYSDMIQKRLNYEYVAQSDFGDYLNTTIGTLQATAQRLSDVITSTQSETTEAGTRTVNINGFIEAGIIGEENGVDVIGIALGQTTSETTAEGDITVFSKAVQLTSGKLSFFDGNGNEIAYVSGDMFKIANGEILNFIRFGDYDVDVSDGVAWKWRGET